MTTTCIRKHPAPIVALAAALIASTACNLVPTPIPTPPAPDPFSGQAALVLSTVNGASATSADTGLLPAAGGELEASLINVGIQGLLSAEVGHSTVVGEGKTTTAESSLAKLDLTLPDHHITVDFLLTRAQASCLTGAPVASGSSELKNVVVDSVPRAIGIAPNSSIDLVDLSNNVVGKVTFNEQITTNPTSDQATIQVTALHIQVFNSADISIGRAFAGIRCIPEPPAPTINDFVTGGGFIDIPGGFAGNFGLVAGSNSGVPFGHLVYIDHGTDLKVKSTSITVYQVVDATKRHFEGTAEVNQVGGFTFQVDVVDNGEPGNNDTFAITLSSGYNANGTLIGGNIQLHTQP